MINNNNYNDIKEVNEKQEENKNQNETPRYEDNEGNIRYRTYRYCGFGDQ